MRHTPYTANAATPADHSFAVTFPVQNNEKIIANPSGASALKWIASAKCPFASANIARVNPHNGQGSPVNQ